LDGIAVNNRAGNAFISVLPVTWDSVEEFRVTTTNYNADQGGTGGAQVSLVTKSGTNNFHGSAYEYHRNTATSANDYFNKQAQINTCVANGTPLNPAPMQPGAKTDPEHFWRVYFPPWETNGLQVTPSPNLESWFNQRALNMLSGIPSSADAPITFDLSGPANGGKPGYYHWDYKDFGPRFAFAWAPSKFGGLLGAIFGAAGQTSIRGGFGMVYDNVGESLVNYFDANGAFGLSSALSNPAGSQSLLTAPRLTDMHTIPTLDLAGNPLLVPAPPGTFPQQFPDTLSTGGFAITWGLDNTIKAPYAYTLDLSWSRDLKNGFSVEGAYVGRLGHRLLAQADVAQPYDFVDKKSGIDYYTAVGALAKLYR
jgi:hypothetical protein